MAAGVDPQRPVLAHHPLVFAEVHERGDARRPRRGEGALPVPGWRSREARVPERQSAARFDGIERPRLHQRLRRLRLQARAAHEVAGAGVGATPLALRHDQLRRGLSHILDDLEPEPHAAVVGDGARLARVHAGVEERRAEAAGILLERLQRVEAHGLVVDERDEELERVVALQPGGLVGGDGEGVGVRLGEHVVAVDLGEDRARRFLGHALAPRPLQEALPLHLDQVLALGASEGAPQFVRLGGGHPRHVHHELHHLLLPDDDAAAPRQGALLQRMVVRPLHPVPVAVDELRDGAALHPHPGPDKRHLVGQVEQVPGAEALGDLELGGRLEEEDALPPPLVDEVVHVRVIGGDATQVGPRSFALLDQVERFLDLVEDGQGEEVDLGEASVGHAVLVPIHDEAARDRPLAGGDHPRDGAVAQHQAADVLAQTPGRVQQLGC